MIAEHEQPLELAGGQTVSTLLTEAPVPFAGLVLAHGAGAGMRHEAMAALAAGLAPRGVTTLRFQFPFMQAGARRVDRPDVAQATVRAAVAAAPEAGALFAGGKSFGARMSSQAQAQDPLPGVRGLVFFGFPLHPAGKPGLERAAHLDAVRLPMLFLQGTRDALAEPALIERVVAGLGGRASLVLIPDADHGFHVPRRSGRTDAEARADMLDAAASWMRRVAGAGL